MTYDEAVMTLLDTVSTGGTAEVRWFGPELSLGAVAGRLESSGLRSFMGDSDRYDDDPDLRHEIDEGKYDMLVCHVGSASFSLTRRWVESVKRVDGGLVFRFVDGSRVRFRLKERDPALEAIDIDALERFIELGVIRFEGDDDAPLD